MPRIEDIPINWRKLTVKLQYDPDEKNWIAYTTKPDLLFCFIADDEDAARCLALDAVEATNRILREMPRCILSVTQYEVVWDGGSE